MPCSTQQSALGASRGYLAEYNAEAAVLSQLEQCYKGSCAYTACRPGFSNRVLRYMCAMLAA